VAIARDAIGEQSAFVAGSVAPLEDCYRPDLVPDDESLHKEHEEQIRWLIEAGVDCLLFETMNTVREGGICSRIASEKNIPFFTSFICNNELQLLSGESVMDAYRAITPYQPAGFLINCTAPETITSIIRKYASQIELPVGGYANAGKSEPEQDGVIDDIYTPQEFLGEVIHWLECNPVLIGGCCGSTPEHIQLISEYLAAKSEAK
jgi:homocysteine S-methyltransferase